MALNTEAALQAIGQIASPEEAAKAAFLASDDASAMKGSAAIYRSGRKARLWQRVKGDLIRSKPHSRELNGGASWQSWQLSAVELLALLAHIIGANKIKK